MKEIELTDAQKTLLEMMPIPFFKRTYLQTPRRNGLSERLSSLASVAGVEIKPVRVHPSGPKTIYDKQRLTYQEDMFIDYISEVHRMLYGLGDGLYYDG